MKKESDPAPAIRSDCRRFILSQTNPEGGTKKLVNLSRIDSPPMRPAMSLEATPAAISTRGTANR